ncbi:hypothetical protein L7F22_035993 [Adiantum nelumboides]|nr:hypothetical protein [Adiantum nelumboides]
MMDDDVLPIAHEIFAESKLVRDEVELSKSHNPSKPLTSIPVNKEEPPSKSPCIAEAFAAARKYKVILGGVRGDQNERLDTANGSKSAKEKDSEVVAWDTSALEKGFAQKVRTGKELVLVIQSLAIFPIVQSDEYADSRVVPQEPSVGLGANDDAGGDALGKEGIASGWSRWKDVRMPFPLGMQTDPLMKDMPPLTRLSRKVLVLDMNKVNERGTYEGLIGCRLRVTPVGLSGWRGGAKHTQIISLTLNTRATERGECRPKVLATTIVIEDVLEGISEPHHCADLDHNDEKGDATDVAGVERALLSLYKA